jgi:hypothetical protein
VGRMGLPVDARSVSLAQDRWDVVSGAKSGFGCIICS